MFKLIECVLFGFAGHGLQEVDACHGLQEVNGCSVCQSV